MNSSYEFSTTHVALATCQPQVEPYLMGGKGIDHHRPSRGMIKEEEGEGSSDH